MHTCVKVASLLHSTKHSPYAYATYTLFDHYIRVCNSLPYPYCTLLIIFFLYSYLKDLVPVINQCVERFLDDLESYAHNKTPISLRDKFALLTLNVISKVSKIIVRKIISYKQEGLV